MTRRHSIAALMGGALILLLAGGTTFAGVPAAPVPAATPAAPVASPGKPAATTVPAAIPAPPADYPYQSSGKPDPFQPFLELDQTLLKKKQEEQQKKATAKGRPISPLQQAEIVQFRLVGIAGDDRRRTAIVEERTTKKYYPLSVGTYIGPNEGRVAEILADRVVVEERIETQEKKAKGMQMRRIPLLLHPEP
jgi:Tfp pilus assembly protein PilP